MWNISVPTDQKVINASTPGLEGPSAMDKAVDTIESMAFLPTSDSATYISKLKILSPVKGELYMFINSNLAMDLTRSINGIPDHEAITDKNRISDAIAEILNIIAGQFMKSILSNDEDFTLGLPVTSIEKQVKLTPGMILRFYEIKNLTLTIGIKGKELLALYTQT